MKKKKLYLIISISVAILSVIGFIVSTEGKKTHRILNERGSSKNFEFKINTASNIDYIFSFWAVDEEGGFKWATISAYAEVVKGDSVLYAKNISFSESEEPGGLKRAQNGFNFKYKSPKSSIITFRGNLKEGDQWQVEVYENMSAEKNMKPGLFIILLVASLFIILKIRAKQS